MNNNIIVIGASAGGVEPLRTIARSLPMDLNAAVLVVLHVWPEGRSILPEILDKAGPLPAFHAQDGEPIRDGRIYVAPPDRHLLVEDGHARLVYGPKENRHRPAVDPLFRSAAVEYKDRTIGVILSGSLDDGTAGLMEIKNHGGTAIVQDPADSVHPGMPRSAIHYTEVDYVLPVARIAEALVQLTSGNRVITSEPIVPESINQQELSEISMLDMDSSAEYQSSGKPAPFACPACHGSLFQKEDGGLLHFRCRIGHAYTADALAEDLGEGIEHALWIALRALEENAAFLRRLGERARHRDRIHVAAAYEGRVAAYEDAGKTIRGMLLKIADMSDQTSENVS